MPFVGRQSSVQSSGRSVGQIDQRHILGSSPVEQGASLESQILPAQPVGFERLGNARYLGLDQVQLDAALAKCAHAELELD